MDERRPQGLAAPRGAGADDLKLIKGVGPELEATAAPARRLPLPPDRGLDARRRSPGSTSNLEGFHGRVTRDGWVEQARELAEQGETPHAHETDRTGRNRMTAPGGKADG